MNVIQFPKRDDNAVSTRRGGRKTNEEYGRGRSYLTPDEAIRLRDATTNERDYALILIAYRHALRVSELSALTWDRIDLDSATIHVKRLKNGKEARHALQEDEVQCLRRLKETRTSRFVFMSGRGNQLSRHAIYDVVRNAGITAGIEFRVHPHMLRHSTGYSLANQGIDTRAIQDFLGHRQISHTVRYTDLAEGRLRHLRVD
jgi:site-specific recombinase XerD